MAPIDRLEPRVFFRGGVVALADRVLTISGTAGDDAIVLRGRSTNLTVTLNGKSTTITRPVRRVVVYAGNGNDRVDAGAADASADRDDLDVRARIDGGNGDDSLYSGLGGDTLIGGRGDDVLQGMLNRDPQDYHDGGRGNDRLFYGGVMYGGMGDDAAAEDYQPSPITGGIERRYTITDARYAPGGDRSLGPSSDALTTRNGRLRYAYVLDGVEDRDFTGPTIREDGVVVVSVHKKPKGDPGIPGRGTTITLRFSEKQTRLALSRGLVMTYRGDTSSRFGLPGDREILAPSA